MPSNFHPLFPSFSWYPNPASRWIRTQRYFQKPCRKERYCGYTSGMAEKRICFLRRFLFALLFILRFFEIVRSEPSQTRILMNQRLRCLLSDSDTRAFVETAISFLLSAVWNPLSQFTLDKSRYHWALLSYLPLQRRYILNPFLFKDVSLNPDIWVSCRNSFLLK